MKICGIFVALVGLLGLVFAQPPTVEWERTFGTPWGDEEAYSVVQMADGHWAAAGSTNGPQSAGLRDFYVIKFDANGDPFYERTYSYVGGQRDEICYAVAATQDDNLILAGVTQAEAGSNDILLIRTDIMGDVVWTRVLQAEAVLDDPHPHQVALDVKIVEVDGADDGILLAGFWETQDHLNKRPLVIETDMQGFVRWSQIYDFFDVEEDLPLACATGVDILPNNVGLAFTGTAMDNFEEPNPLAFYATTYYPWGELDNVCWPEGDLAVSPVVNADGTISMIVQASIGNLSISEIIRGTQQCEIFGLGTFPQTVLDRLRVENGGPMTLAGAQLDEAGVSSALGMRLFTNGDTQWQVPLLGDLPVVGRLFHDVRRDHQQTNLLIFVGAEIIDHRGPDDIERDLYIAKMAEPLSAEDVPVAADFAMSAYPNPFNPTTTISFSLEQTTAVSLVIYDVLGQEVARLVDGELNAGQHQLTFDGADLPSGLYIARLATPQQTMLKKLVLIK